MRVAHVVRQCHPGRGALETFVLSLAKQQRLAGVNAEVITLDRLFGDPGVRLPSYDSVQGVPVRRIGYVGSTRYPLALGILTCIEPFDIVHVHGTGFFCDYLALTQLAHRKPLVISTHANGFDARRAGFLGPMLLHARRRIPLRRYGRIFACGADDDAILRRMPSHKIARIGNGGDAAKFADAASRKFAPTLVYFGSFSSSKGIERLIDAFDALCADVPRARLHLMGRESGGFLPALDACIAVARRRSAITVHVDPTDDDIRRVVAKSCFFVSASHHEEFGFELIEALGAGLVPVVSQIASFARVLKGSGIGLLTDFADAGRAGGEMAAFVHETAKKYGDLRAEAMRLADSHSWQKVARRSMQEYEGVLAMREREILGVTMRPLSRKQAVARIDGALVSGERLNVCFANAHSLTIANENERFRAALRHFLVLNDGLGVDIASRIKFGKAFAANLNGTDFVPDFLAMTRHRLRVYLVGTADAAIKIAAAKLAANYRRHKIVGWRNGFFTGPEDVEETCRKIRAAKADCVLVGMGNPLQELWIDEHGDKTGARLLFGVGALFDFKAESVRRAPAWMRNLRCEWVYRLLQEPRRLARRYLVDNFIFLSKVLADGQR